MGRSPGGGNGNPLQCSCLKNPMDRGGWWLQSPWGHKELDKTEHACTHSKPLLHLVNKLPLNKCYPTVFELLNKPHMRAQLPEGSLAGPACSMTSVLINIPSMPTYKEGKSSLKGIQVCLQRGGVGWTDKYNAADQQNPTQGPLVGSDV